MKQTLVKGIVGAAVVATLAACADTFEPGGGNGTGLISPAIGVNSAVVSSRDSRAELGDVTADMLSLKLSSADGSFSRTWDKLADFDATEKFNVGDYTLEAFYGDEDSEGFEKPYVWGQTTVKVLENQTSRVSLTATLANAMVSIVLTPEFRAYMDDYSAEVHSAGGAYTFYSKTENRPVYVKPGTVELSVSLRKPNGVEGSLSAAAFTAEPRHHYTMTFGLSQGTGEAVLEVIYDETLDEETVNIDLSDDLLNAPAPEITAEGFTDGQTIAFVPGNAPADALKANIMARGGLSRVTLTVQSASLEAQGWPAEIELISAPENMRQRLAALGLKCLGLFSNPDKMAVIDFTDVLAHITTVENGSNVSTFTLQVVDKLGKTCAGPLSFKAEATPLEISLANPGVLLMGASSFDIDLNYNGGDPAKAVKIQYKNDRGTWSDATVTFAAVSDGVYRATVSGLPADAEDLTLRASAGSTVSATVTVPRTAVELEAVVNDNDVFATHATVSARIAGDNTGVDVSSVLAKSAVMLSADGGNTYTAAAATVADGAFRLTGLTAGTAYKVKIDVPGAANASAPAALNTEAAASLPNGNMEDWTSTAHKSNMVEYFLGGDVWDTLNGLTISQWNSGGIFAANAAYRATSGTIPTTDTPSGSGKAALIRTIAWGHGTTSAGGATILKHVDRGELFLGKWEGGGDNGVMPTYGIAFASRPSSLSFYYKFTEVNGQKGSAEVTVFDAAGNKLASNSFEISAQNAYVLKTLPLEYAAGAAKAARVEVIFRSSAPGVSFGKSDLTWGSGSSQTHTGSMLYIDDIEFNY